jgi:hypothetical protein
VWHCARSAPLSYELVESLTGPSIWEDFLKERGPGMHHFGYYADDIDGAIEAMAARLRTERVPATEPDRQTRNGDR